MGHGFYHSKIRHGVSCRGMAYVFFRIFGCMPIHSLRPIQRLTGHASTRGLESLGTSQPLFLLSRLAHGRRQAEARRALLLLLQFLRVDEPGGGQAPGKEAREVGDTLTNTETC